MAPARHERTFHADITVGSPDEVYSTRRHCRERYAGGGRLDFCHADLQRAHVKPYVRAVDYDAHERMVEHEYRSVLIYSINGNQQFMSKMDIENFCKYDAFLFARRDESEVAQKYSAAALKLSIAVGMMTAAIFCLLSEGRQLHMRPSKNLFAPVKFSAYRLEKFFARAMPLRSAKFMWRSSRVCKSQSEFVERLPQ